MALITTGLLPADTCALLAAIREHPFEREPKLQLIDHAIESPEPFLNVIAMAVERAPQALIRGALDDDRLNDWTYRPRPDPAEAAREFGAAMAWAAAMGSGVVRRQNCARTLTSAVNRLMPGYLGPNRYNALVVAAVALGYRWMFGCEDRIYLGIMRRFDAAVVPAPKQRPRHIEPERMWNPWVREWQ